MPARISDATRQKIVDMYEHGFLDRQIHDEISELQDVKRMIGIA